MTRTEELYESARLTELHNRTKIVTVSAKDMMQLVELVRLQQSALRLVTTGSELGDFLDSATMPFAACKDLVVMEDAIAAFEKFERGEK